MGAPREFDTGLAPGDLDPQHPRPVETPWGTMALYVVDGRVVCLQAFCPHMEGPLFQGTLSPLEGPDAAGGERGLSVTCPWHRWRYDVCSGARLDPSREEDPLDDPLVRCEVGRSARGTILLRRPEA